ncbi:hypothetical protein L4X63_16160 [Geomonas sp. Red32]|uniref:hypothetical protein n=1 Tax=Geomonas sp. Red32 TaxID=2912856 RepID=UPI00202D090B|nr:hypothetical protein [Geomonas sp. Red32]MCM0083123.1 hypothetical protein [Geomonas sp. Red32]
MSRFYDPKDERDLARVEEILRKGGIEFFVTAAKSGSGFAGEIEVAEEDIPKAHELIGKPDTTFRATQVAGRSAPQR